jgi:asparagine synthase (glutamine-hydrolysing)
VNFRERLRVPVINGAFRDEAQKALYWFVHNGFRIHLFGFMERSATRFGLESRHPFNDHRLVEFAAALPNELCYRDGQPKFVVRQAMRGLLPEGIRTQGKQGDGSCLFVEALLGQGGERAFDSMKIASLGWVDGARIRAMCRELMEAFGEGKPDSAPHCWPLWMSWGLEAWYRTVFEAPGTQKVEIGCHKP